MTDERAVQVLAAALTTAAGITDWDATEPDDDVWRIRARETLQALPEPIRQNVEAALANPICEGYCGSLGWTIKVYGQITHKHNCPHRTDPFCQSHREGCGASR